MRLTRLPFADRVSIVVVAWCNMASEASGEVLNSMRNVVSDLENESDYVSLSGVITEVGRCLCGSRRVSRRRVYAAAECGGTVASQRLSHTGWAVLPLLSP